jgi:hypothetical protein
MDATLWKAYFRLNAQYTTRCEVCMKNSDSNEKGIKISSSSDDDDDSEDYDEEFDPVSVSRTSPVGKMMTKWLNAARRKLGGNFPRPSARAQVDQYTQRLRNYKLRKAKKQNLVEWTPQQMTEKAKAVNQSKNPFEEPVIVSAATEALAKRWIRLAREYIGNRKKNKTLIILDETEKLLETITKENDWYYSGLLRLEGEDILREGKQIQENRLSLESDCSVRIHKIELDFEKLISDSELEIIHERLSFELKCNQRAAQLEKDILMRTKQIEKAKETRRLELANIEQNTRLHKGMVSDEMKESHEEILKEFDREVSREKIRLDGAYKLQDQKERNTFEKIETFRKNEIENKKSQAHQKISRIRVEVAEKVNEAEAVWKTKANRWNSLAKTKIETKKREDEMMAHMSGKTNTGTGNRLKNLKLKSEKK